MVTNRADLVGFGNGVARKLCGFLLVLAVLGGGLVLVPSLGSPAAATGSYAAKVLAKGPQYYWQLDDSPPVSSDLPGTFDEEVEDSSWLRRKSAYVTPGVAGVVDGGNAISFDAGASGRHVVGSQESLVHTSTATVDLWIKPASLPAAGEEAPIFDSGDNHCCFVQYAGLTLAIDSDGVVHGWAGLGFSPRKVSSVSQVSVGVWSHLTLTYDQEGFLFIAVDGSVENVTRWAPGGLYWYGPSSGIKGAALGSSANATPFPPVFHGAIDDVAIFGGNTSGSGLDASDIAEIHVASGRPIGGVPLPALDEREVLGSNSAVRNMELTQQCECDPVDVLTGNLHMPVP